MFKILKPYQISIIYFILYLASYIYINLYIDSHIQIEHIACDAQEPSISETLKDPVSNQSQNKFNPEDTLCYFRDGKQYIAHPNNIDPNNPYKRADLIYQIKDLVYRIQCIKTLRDYTKGFVWNEWRRYIVEARTPESYALDKYFQDIFDNVETYTTKELIKTLMEQRQFWDHM